MSKSYADVLTTTNYLTSFYMPTRGLMDGVMTMVHAATRCH
ncbi:hypothetical protein RMSM_07717 [Rhodopirellula maiorica SM1]|uniref:Uncharacterized protein n=1 Tax=Rhodopirellula maiorica SM1 TaxID=1265738 RepID=M5RJ12_9BACT|nr:hypothetical protein RMSM_07717 [Rhodopirellula maiorica SM1]